MQPSVFEILNDPELYSQHCHSLRETLLDHFNHQATLIDTYEHELEKSKNANKAFQQALSEIGTVDKRKMMDLLVFGDHLQTMLILWLLI